MRRSKPWNLVDWWWWHNAHTALNGAASGMALAFLLVHLFNAGQLVLGVLMVLLILGEMIVGRYIRRRFGFTDPLDATEPEGYN